MSLFGYTYHIDFSTLYQNVTCLWPDLHILRWRGPDGGGVTDERHCRASDRSSTFVSVKPWGIFEETLGQFPAAFVAQTRLFLRTPCDTSSCVLGNQRGYFKPKHDLLLTPTKWFLCRNLTGPWAQWCDNIKQEIGSKEAKLQRSVKFKPFCHLRIELYFHQYTQNFTTLL